MKPDSQHIQTLLDRYKHSMIEKADVVSQHLEILLEEEEPASEVLGDIKQNLHKLAGSSGMYGYDDLANITREAMQLIDQNNYGRLQQQLLALRNLLRQHAKR